MVNPMSTTESLQKLLENKDQSYQAGGYKAQIKEHMAYYADLLKQGVIKQQTYNIKPIGYINK